MNGGSLTLEAGAVRISSSCCMALAHLHVRGWGDMRDEVVNPLID